MKIAVLIIAMASFVFAHEGHDHDTPAKVRAPKGGIIKSVENVHIEVVSRGKNIKVYIYDHDMKPQNIETFRVSAKVQFPRSKKEEELVLANKKNFFEADFDAKGAHRYTLVLTVMDPKEGHNDVLNYTVEPH